MDIQPRVITFPIYYSSFSCQRRQWAPHLMAFSEILTCLLSRGKIKSCSPVKPGCTRDGEGQLGEQAVVL